MSPRMPVAVAVAALTVAVATPASLAAVPARVDTVPGLPASAVSVMDGAPYAGATWAVQVTDTVTGQRLVDYNAESLLEPGSTMKTLSTAGAWLTYGPTSRITTPVVRAGRVRAGVLDGNLILVAKGDITLGGQTGANGQVVWANMDHNDANDIPGAQLADTDPMRGLDALARQVRASGIRSIAGDVVVDDRLWRTEILEPNGPVSPIVVNSNLIDLLVHPAAAGRPATVKTRMLVAPWTVDNKVRTVAAGGSTAVAVRADGSRLVLSGTIAADAAPVLRVWAVPDPASFARTAFIDALTKAGVRVGGDKAAPNPAAELPSRRTVAGLPVVGRYVGLPMQEQITYVLKVSYNRGAQAMVCLLAVKAGSQDCDAGYPVLRQALVSIGVDPTSFAMVDGSGLPGNYVTPDGLVSLMVGMSRTPNAEQWRLALPIMGIDGSIVDVQKDAPSAGHVWAKTGTLGDADLLNERLRLGTKALSGYLQAKSGRWLSFAVLVNQSMFTDIYGVFAANEDLGKITTAIWETY